MNTFIQIQRPPLEMVDRRKEKRNLHCLPTKFYLEWSKDKRILFDAILINLSTNGAYLEYLDSKRKIKLDLEKLINKKLISIELPIPDAENPLNLNGVINRSQIVGGQIGIGVCFENNSKRKILRLADAIK